MQITHQLPTELWTEIFQPLTTYDIMLFRSSCKGLRALLKQLKPFGPMFTLNQQKCVEYFALLGSVSCLEYCLSLGFEMDFDKLADLIVGEGKTPGHIEVLKFCEKNGIKNTKTQLAKICVQSQCNFKMLKYLCEAIREYGVVAKPDLSLFLPAIAAEHGHYNCMNMLIDTGFTLGKTFPYTPNKQCLQYFLSKNLEWPKSFMSRAAAEGNLQMMKFAREQHGAPFPENLTEIKTADCAEYLIQKYGLELHSGADCVINAITKNNVEVVKYFIKHNIVRSVSADTLLLALRASKEMYELLEPNLSDDIRDAIDRLNPFDSPIIVDNNDIETFKFASEKWPLSKEQAFLCFQRAFYSIKNNEENDEISMVRYLGEIFPFDFDVTMYHAASVGNVKRLQYLTEKGVQWNEHYMYVAAKYGNFGALVYLHKIGCPWNSKVCDFASNVMCLKYAREHGCPWTEERFTRLFENLQYSEMHQFAKIKSLVNIPILRYAVWNGCPMTKETQDDINFLIEHHPKLKIRYNPKK